ncbi:MAG TPA: PilZ domain-containing protein [Thiotrichales bacterium]|nr:PilZ domain-containing protein [Thiotrichales bacterium]
MADNEKRRYHRVPFDADVTLACSGHHCESQLLDISLKGALVEKPVDWPAETGESCELIIHLSDGETIRMDASVAHVENRCMGLRCEYIDIDSVSHLRRLVELNTRDESILHRELEALSSRTE